MVRCRGGGRGGGRGRGDMDSEELERRRIEKGKGILVEEPEDRSSEPGPIDGSLLLLQNTHRSKLVWEHDPEVVDSLLDARHGRIWELDTRLERYVIEAGFWPWYMVVRNVVCDLSQLTALIERWRPETHTFHLRDGEMTIGIQDVAMLGGLITDGQPVTGTDNVESYTPLCLKTLGVDPERHGKRHNCIRRSWLEKEFAIVPADASEEVLQRHATAFLLYLIGATLFPDASGNLISLHYLPLLEDLAVVSKYSWGSAALAYLYRSMCNVVTKKGKSLCGPAVLLQLWAWERMMIGRPKKIVKRKKEGEEDDEEEVDPSKLPSWGFL